MYNVGTHGTSWHTKAGKEKRLMPYRFDFDAANRILRGRLEGRVTDVEFEEFYKRAGKKAARIRPRAGIMDFSAVTSFEVSPDTIRALAKLPPAMPNPSDPRFLVAPADTVFGMARMFQVEGEQTRPNSHVVRTLKEVCAILGIEQLNFEPMQTE